MDFQTMEISAAVLLDAGLVLVMLVSVIAGARRGLLKSLWKITAWIITIVLIIILKTPFTSMIAQTDTALMIYNSISEKITPVFTDSLYGGEISHQQQTQISELLHLPTIVVSQVLNDYDEEALTIGSSAAVDKAVDNISRSITMMILGFIAAVILFILIKIALFIIYRILDSISKLPVINSANKLLGAVSGFINVLFMVYIVCAIVSFIATDNSEVYRMISETYIVKYFYNYNILLQLFMNA